jgi:hypothetical protein
MVVDGVGAFLMFLNKICNVALTCGLCLYLLESQSSEIEYLAAPLIVIKTSSGYLSTQLMTFTKITFFLAYSIVSSFCSVFSMAIDTIFLCFCKCSVCSLQGQANDTTLQ